MAVNVIMDSHQKKGVDLPPVIVSGMRPTGRLHLGHYFGVLKNWMELQEKSKCYFFVADWHSLTTEYAQVQAMGGYVREMVTDWLASGISPDKAVMFVQSHVPEHAELHVLLSMITPIGWLERVPSYKELQQELTGKDLSTYGFLGYPLLQAADVVIYKATGVPVGQDQVAHIELAREIVRRFNHLYRDIFPEPAALLTKAAKLLGLDGRKMSKSYNNSVFLSDSAEESAAKFKGCMTDPARKRRTDAGNPDICPVFDYHKLVTSTETQAQINTDCRSAAIGCIDCKKILSAGLDKELAPFRERRASLDPKMVTDVLTSGSQKARATAAATMTEVREAMGLTL